MAGDYQSNLNNQIRDRVCTFLGNAANMYGALNEATGGDPSTLSEIGASVLGQIQNAYRGYCNAEPPPPPNSGGECPIGYGINCTFAVYLLGGQFAYRRTLTSDCNFAPFIFGPVGGARIKEQGGFIWYVVSGFGSNGVATEADITDRVNTLVYRTPVIESLEFYPCNQAEATCDRPPIPSPEIEFPVRLPDINFNYGDETNNFNFSAEVTVEAPRVDIRGNFRFPVTLNFGPNDINISPSVRFEFGDSTTNNYITNSPPPPPPIRTRDPIETIERDENDDEPPPPPPPPPGSQIVLREGRVYLGMLVVSDVTDEANVSVINQEPNPPIYVPSLGHVNFWVKVGNREAWSGDIKVKNTYQFVQAPDPLRTIAAYGTPQPGVEMKFFPVYISMEDFLGYSVVNTPSLED